MSITRDITYEQVWEHAKGWAYKYGKYAPRYCDIEVEDFIQECALRFWGKWVKKYSPYHCFCLADRGFRCLLAELQRKPRVKTCKLCEKIYALEKDDDDFDENLKPHYKMVCQLVIDGYETKEIADMLGYTVETVYGYIKHIKRFYAEKYGIKDYQRKHLRGFTRNGTESELANWQKSKERLAVVAASRRKANQEQRARPE